MFSYIRGIWTKTYLFKRGLQFGGLLLTESLYSLPSGLQLTALLTNTGRVFTRYLRGNGNLITCQLKFNLVCYANVYLKFWQFELNIKHPTIKNNCSRKLRLNTRVWQVPLPPDLCQSSWQTAFVVRESVGPPRIAKRKYKYYNEIKTRKPVRIIKLSC